MSIELVYYNVRSLRTRVEAAPTGADKQGILSLPVTISDVSCKCYPFKKNLQITTLYCTHDKAPA